MEKLARVPPENTSRSERSGLDEKSWPRLVLSIPAAGMWATNLKTKTTTAVIKSFLLMVGEARTLEKNWAIELSMLC